MDKLDYSGLCQKANEWKQYASHLDFLGEIALSQGDLEGLLVSLGRFRRRVDEPLLAFALSVAAVNWAYWRGVDEEESRSFIKSFMEHSVGYSDSREWDSLWGPAIEDAICHWSKQPPRTGAYRYVGLILRHAGVPYAKLPKLAQLLKDIDHDMGWALVPTTRDARLRDHVAAHFPIGILGEHLSSDAGVAFLRSLCADLTLLRSKASHTPDDLPGYRPGLLAALLKHMTLGARVPVPPSLQMPFVILDAADGRLELVFDERLVRRKDQIHCEQIEGRLFDTRLDLGPGGVSPASTYSGIFPNGRPWAIKGWKYTDPNAWALFRIDGRLVTTHAHSDAVAIGEYLLATVSQEDQSARWADAGEEGDRQLPDGTECRLWHVDLREGDDDKLPNLQITTETQLWIACVNAGRLTRWSELDAICPAAPEIQLGGWSGRASRRFRLQIAMGPEERDLHPEPSGGGVTTVVLSDLPIGVAAELRLIPVGFQHGPRATQILKVLRFPGELSVSDGLCSLSEAATLSVALGDGLQLSTSEGIEIQRDGPKWLVVVPPFAHVASLILTRADKSLALRIPVRRCSFSFSNAPTHRVYFDHAFLKQMCHGSATASGFTITGIPGSPFDLLVRDRRGNTRTWRRGLKLGSNGRLDLNATEIVDVARQESGVLEILVECHGFTGVQTGAFFVKPTLDDLEAPEWPAAIQEFFRILRQPLDIHESLDAIVDSPCLLSRIGLVAIIDLALGLSVARFNWPATVESSSWVTEIRSLLADPPRIPGASARAWKNRLLQWLNACPLAFTPERWAAAVKARVAEVDRTVDIAGPLHRMLAGHADPAVPHGITHGWQAYVEAVTSGPTRDSKFLQANAYFMAASRGAPPWSEIARRLSAWTLLRAGAIRAFLASLRDLSACQDCPGLDQDFIVVGRILGMTWDHAGSRVQGGLELSADAHDRLLSAALWGNSQNWIVAADSDWLSSWLAWRWSLIMGVGADQRAYFRAVVCRHAGSVPFRAQELVTHEIRADAALAL